MKRATAPPEIGRPAHVPARAHNGSWVQTERAGHEAWARLTIKHPIASSVMHTLVARMGKQNAVVISQKTLSALIGVTDRSIRTAIATLVTDRWIQVVRLNGPGTVAAYVVNSVVSWSDNRSNLHLAAFTATIVADADDQTTIEHADLRQIPSLYVGERQLPTGPGDDPPSQPVIPGFEPELPFVEADNPNPFAHMAPEQIDVERGRVFQVGLRAGVDPDTGEIELGR